jgi:hypothetical protein
VGHPTAGQPHASDGAQLSDYQVMVEALLGEPHLVTKGLLPSGLYGSLGTDGTTSLSAVLMLLNTNHGW